MLIYKIVDRVEWAAAERAGVFAGAPIDRRDGFIHFSTAAQVRATARLHFAGRDELLLVSVEADRLGPTLAWEPSRGGDLFPHLYASLAVADVTAAVALPLGPDGAHRFPDDVP